MRVLLLIVMSFFLSFSARALDEITEKIKKLALCNFSEEDDKVCEGPYFIDVHSEQEFYKQEELSSYEEGNPFAELIEDIWWLVYEYLDELSLYRCCLVSKNFCVFTKKFIQKMQDRFNLHWSDIKNNIDSIYPSIKKKSSLINIIKNEEDSFFLYHLLKKENISYWLLTKGLDAPFECAIKNKKEKFAKAILIYLIQRENDNEIRDFNERCLRKPFFVTIQYEHKKLFDLIICYYKRNGCNFLEYIRDEEGRNPLHIAAQYSNNAYFAHKLININKKLAFIPNKKKNLPLLIAVINDNVDVVRFLLSCKWSLVDQAFLFFNASGLSFNPVNYNADGVHDTALHIAAQKGNEEMVQVLLKAGSRRNAKNRRGQTPADVASTDAIKIMIRYG